MTRRFLILFTIFQLFTLSASSQDVFNEIRKLSQEVSRNTNKSNFERSIALFKLDALEYLGMKSREVMPDSSAIVLDTQAYGLYEFCFYYAAAYEKARTKAGKQNVVNVFREVSLSCPRFDDKEYDICRFYSDNHDKTNNTPFNLDCDWVKAVAMLKEKGYYF